MVVTRRQMNQEKTIYRNAAKLFLKTNLAYMQELIRKECLEPMVEGISTSILNSLVTLRMPLLVNCGSYLDIGLPIEMGLKMYVKSSQAFS